jgi:hypothetical protein
VPPSSPAPGWGILYDANKKKLKVYLKLTIESADIIGSSNQFNRDAPWFGHMCALLFFTPCFSHLSVATVTHVTIGGATC